MKSDPPPRSWRRFVYARKILQAFHAETRGQFRRAIELLDEASEITFLRPPERVQRAVLLAKDGCDEEAHQAFASLRTEFKRSDDPNVQYLRHFCTNVLSQMTRSSTQWLSEAEQAQKIKCAGSLKRRFRMVTMAEIEDQIERQR